MLAALFAGDTVVLAPRFDAHEVWRAGNTIRLTATEFNLLRFFLLNPRRVDKKLRRPNRVHQSIVLGLRRRPML